MDEVPATGLGRSGPGRPLPASPLPPGTTRLAAGDPANVGEFLVLARFSSGEAASAYLARAPGGALVVVKLARTQPAGGNRLRRNFIDAAGVRLPTRYAARVLSRGSHEGRAYLVREYVDGMTLAELVAEDGRLDRVTLNAVAVATAAALTAVHDTDEVHGNLKPTNVMVTLAGVRLLDHGLARRSGQPRPDPADDVLGWGRLLAFAGTGRLLATPAAEASLDVGVLDKPIGPLVERALAADPLARPAARAVLLGLVCQSTETGGTAAPRWRRRR